MYGCESWTIKKAERQRIDAFELWCWRRLESPLDCKEIQPSILKEIGPKYSLVLKLKFQYFDHLMQRMDSLENLQELVMDREAWHAAVLGVAKNLTRLSD